MSQSKSVGFSYTHAYDLKDRIMYMDIDYLRNEQGRFKIIEIALLLLAAILSSEVHGIRKFNKSTVGLISFAYRGNAKNRGERGFAMIVCGIGILLTFTIWVSKILTLHRQLHPGNWLLIESLVYVFIISGLFIAAGFMAYFATAHWTIRNPQWQTMPLLATIVLFSAGVVYLVDLFILFRKRANRTFIPDVSTYQI